MVKKVVLLSSVLLGLLFWITAGKCFAVTANVWAQLEQANKYEVDKKYNQAEAIYKQISADYPGTDYALEAQKGLVIVYIEWGKQAQADAALEETITKFSEHEGIAKAVDHVADRYRKLKRYEKARDLYTYTVGHWPGAEHAPESQRGVALASILLQDEANAEAATEKLLREFGEREGVVEVVEQLADDTGT